VNVIPFGLSLSFDKLRMIGLPFALSLSFDKLRMIGIPFALSPSKCSGR
jgi:hypothetical protein